MVQGTRNLKLKSLTIKSAFLQRSVTIDCYIPVHAEKASGSCHLLLVNDGQDLVRMPFGDILEELYLNDRIPDVLCVGIHCGPERKQEYGVAAQADYAGRGSRASLYEQFVLAELMPLIREKSGKDSFLSIGFAGFSLGGLTALDLVWRHPDLFSIAGVFSGSLWWRSVAQDAPEFDEEHHRIMHQQIKMGEYHPGLRFFFETGTLDETADRNNNGIIDSIDDTLALIHELKQKGYAAKDIAYLQLADGRHDVATWARAFPDFLRWAYERSNQV